MIPRSASKEFYNNDQDNISSDSEDSSGAPGNFLNSNIIHEYLTMCGRIMQILDLEKLMDEVETLFNIEGFNGHKDAQIDLDTFYRFMTSFLVQEKEQPENETKGEKSELIDEGKKSESKSIESTNQSEGRHNDSIQGNDTPKNQD